MSVWLIYMFLFLDFFQNHCNLALCKPETCKLTALKSWADKKCFSTHWITSSCLFSQAQTKEVHPPSSCRLMNFRGSAFCVKMMCTQSRWPFCAAKCKQVMPSSPRSVKSAPEANRYLTMLGRPLSQARGPFIYYVSTFWINRNIFTNFSLCTKNFKLNTAWKFCQNLMLTKNFFYFDEKTQFLWKIWKSN